MKILYHHRTLADGAEGIHIREMVAAFRALGHEVRVAALVGEPRGSSPVRKSRWTGVSHLLPASLYEFAEIGYNAIGRASLARAIREFQPDAVYDRYNSYSTAAITAARAGRVPVVLEVNAPVAYERVAYENKPLRMAGLAVRYERWICSSADHVFAVSSPLARFLVNERSVPQHRVTVLPNGANPATFQPARDDAPFRERLGLSGRVVAGFVGILRPWHGLDLLVEATRLLAPRYPDLHLLIVGDGPIELELRRAVDAAGLRDRVAFTGRVAHADIAHYVGAMDFAVSPKATFYASPMKILEYMAVGKAVIAPAMDNIRDLLSDGRTGLLFEPDNAADLARTMEEAIRSEERRRSIGEAARRAIEQRLNWEHNAREVVETVERLLTRRGTPPPTART